MNNCRHVAAALFLSLLLLAGCPSPGVYRTARTLEPGQYDLGTSINYSFIRLSPYELKASDAGIPEEMGGDDLSTSVLASKLHIPNLIPELQAHGGVAPNLEVGGRFAPANGLLEADVKYRFLCAAGGKIHMALQLAAGYYTHIALKGPSVSLPLLFTWDVARWFSLTAYGYARYQNVEPAQFDLDELSMHGISAGGGIGLQFRIKRFYIMPAVDVATSVASFDDNIASRFDLLTVITGLHLGWVGGGR